MSEKTTNILQEVETLVSQGKTVKEASEILGSKLGRSSKAIAVAFYTKRKKAVGAKKKKKGKYSGGKKKRTFTVQPAVSSKYNVLISNVNLEDLTKLESLNFSRMVVITGKALTATEE